MKKEKATRVHAIINRIYDSGDAAQTLILEALLFPDQISGELYSANDRARAIKQAETIINSPAGENVVEALKAVIDAIKALETPETGEKLDTAGNR